MALDRRLDMYVSDSGQLNFPTAGIFSFDCSCVVSNRQGALQYKQTAVPLSSAQRERRLN
jgi:hypothetical protein